MAGGDSPQLSVSGENSSKARTTQTIDLHPFHNEHLERAMAEVFRSKTDNILDTSSGPSGDLGRDNSLHISLDDVGRGSKSEFSVTSLSTNDGLNSARFSIPSAAAVDLTGASVTSPYSMSGKNGMTQEIFPRPLSGPFSATWTQSFVDQQNINTWSAPAEKIKLPLLSLDHSFADSRQSSTGESKWQLIFNPQWRNVPEFAGMTYNPGDALHSRGFTRDLGDDTTFTLTRDYFSRRPIAELAHKFSDRLSLNVAVNPHDRLGPRTQTSVMFGFKVKLEDH